MTLPKRVQVVEVGPRDGLQNEPGIIDTAARVALIDGLAEAGVKTIEAGSFVNPQWVPQMAGSDELFAQIRRRPGVTYSALTPNLKGFERALAAGADEVAIFASATDAFSLKNINCTIVESIERFKPVTRAATDAGLRVRAYLSCAFGCPYAGAVSAEQVASVAAQLMDLGCYEIAISDTIGTGTPLHVARVIEAVSQRIPTAQQAMHFHDTYGQALANVLMALQCGVSVFDSAVAGLGGCPYARGASGNLATEDLLYMLNGMGIETGIDLAKVVKVGRQISAQLGVQPRSKVNVAINIE